VATAAALLILSACGDDNKQAAAPAPDAPAPDAATDGPPVATPGPLVMTTAGPVRGSATASMQSFRGLPYAKPPVGDLRWKPPVAPDAFTAERDATKAAPHCAQSGSPFGMASTSEDCLYLNVYAPTTAGPHPVMFWIHGGALLVGESDEYDATPLVAQGVVVVTINYRLGVLGFVSHPALSAEQAGHSGNYGFMDQQFALHWVQDNIAKFGGDKASVTIFGESAGGLSVHAQLVMDGAAGLFHKAIIESGAYAVLAPAEPTLAAAEATGSALATAATCPNPCTAAALRALPLDKILTAQAAVASWLPAVDGKVLKAPISTAYLAGNYLKVPIIEGSNHDEYRLFVALNELQNANHVLAASEIPAAVKAGFGVDDATANALVANHPVASYDDNPSLAFAAIGTDFLFACNSRATASTFATSTTSKVFAYEFNDPTATELFLPAVASFPSYGAAHASEIQYVFTLPGSMLSTDSKALSGVMVKYWTNFARTGDPNGADLPAWPAYTTRADGILELKTGAGNIQATTMFAIDHKCAFASLPAL
jgi:para-nitrobenzyl esterase